jgi:hypothetical protein
MTMKSKRLVSFLAGGALLLVMTAVLPTPASELGGPDTIELNQLEGPYQPVIFDHRRHAAEFAESCGDCHHQHRGYEKLPCKRCHAIDKAQFKESVVRSFRPCGNCHGDYDPATPDVPGLKVAFHEVCFSCHKGMGDLGRTPAGCEQQCHARK